MLHTNFNLGLITKPIRLTWEVTHHHRVQTLQMCGCHDLQLIKFAIVVCNLQCRMLKKNTLQTGLHSLCGSQSLHAPAQARVKVMKLTLSNHVSCIGCNTLATPTKHSWLLKHIALGYSVYPTITDCCRARFLMKVSRPTGCRPCVKNLVWGQLYRITCNILCE